MKTIFLAVAIASIPLMASAAETSAPPPAPAPPRAAPPAPATPAPQGAAASEAKVLTINSTVGELIDNPKTDAVLKKIIPDVRSNGMFDTMGRDISLAEITQYETDITPEKLKAIGEELAKVQAPGAAAPAAPQTARPTAAPPPPPPAAPPPPVRQP